MYADSQSTISLWYMYILQCCSGVHTGQAKAEAQSCAEAAKIGEAAVEQAKLKAEASKIEAVSSNNVNSYKGVNWSTLLRVFNSN